MNGTANPTWMYDLIALLNKKFEVNGATNEDVARFILAAVVAVSEDLPPHIQRKLYRRLMDYLKHALEE